MVDYRRAQQLPQQHKEDRVAKPEPRRHIGDADNIEGDEASGQEQVFWCFNRFCRREPALQQSQDDATQKGDGEQDHRCPEQYLEMPTKCCVGCSQHRNAEPHQKHDNRICRHANPLFFNCDPRSRRLQHIRSHDTALQKYWRKPTDWMQQPENRHLSEEKWCSREDQSPLRFTRFLPDSYT